MKKEIPSIYNPKENESRWYAFWESIGAFKGDPKSSKAPYSVVIPPPNVTGILHMGHALNNTIQDIIIRYKRMSGMETLWMPGTDHAGIATQNVVERKLRKENKNKDQLGRDSFLKEVWKWRDEYGSTIIKQLKKLGCSCDWQRTRFTMDEGLSEAVKEVFVRLYDKGLIYRGNYIINWCPRCKTALSDEEAEHRDVDGALYHIKYPIASHKKETNPTKGDFVIVATTRPETMLGDVAVCVNPKDKRYKHLIGKNLILPILNREIKVISDRKVDTDFGTGALKVTPAHDPVDFELGLIHGLERINVMNDDATINDIGADFSGMDRFEARKAIVEELKQRGLFVKSEPHRHAVGHCYRCHTIVEPRLSKQWFVSMKPLAKPAIEAVRSGRIKFYPSRWTKVYLNWMENIRDWCISRQIWWGHRIPVYYCADCFSNNDDDSERSSSKKGIIVSATEPKTCPECGSSDISQDEDVLDTWFSSWLWPFSTFGWPDKTALLKKFYPTNVLVTAQEIIFFWVARMIMSGLEFMGQVPFSDVYIHGTVRDDTGTKMSKTLGNIIDPLEIIDDFGTDALRFSIISITGQGQDIYLSPKKFEIGRNFANKLWNASRFVLMNLKEEVLAEWKPSSGIKDLSLADKWILSRYNSCLRYFSQSLEAYRLNDAANRIYDFIWHEFCDWYVELAKLSINDEHTQKTLFFILEHTLRILHPIMPYVTEEIWHSLPGERDKESLMLKDWPSLDKNLISKKIDADMGFIIKIIQSVRNLRSEWRIEPGKFVDLSLSFRNKEDMDMIKVNDAYIKRLARIGELDLSLKGPKPRQSAVSVLDETEIFLPLSGVINVDKEKKRLDKAIDELTGFLNNIAKKLENKTFLEKAPEQVIKKEIERRKVIESELAGLRKNLAEL